MHSPAKVAVVFSRDRVLISTCIALLTALAWLYLLHLDRQMSSSMQYETMMANMGMPVDRAWTAADLFFTFLMWAVMMIGMMAGAAIPVLLLFAAAQGRRGQRRASTLLAFGLGYIAIWAGFSAFASAAQWTLHQLKLLSPAMAASSPVLGGAILVGAGLYQLTRFKSACLSHCQSPLGFLMTHWRDGLLGALQMGLRHGAYCLGCCWALMGVLFVVGVMNLAWVAALSGFVLLEKIGPAGAAVARVAGVGMVVFGIVLIARVV